MKKTVSILLLISLLLCGCAQISNETSAPTRESTEAPTTVPETTQPPVLQEEPAADGVLDVLIVGNSFSVAWPDELSAMLLEEGIKARVYAVYYSGCKMEQHWQYWQAQEREYVLYEYKQEEKFTPQTPGMSLMDCLQKQNWDVISLQHHFGGAPAWSYNGSLNASLPYAKDLFNELKALYPKTRFVWHQTWTYEIGTQYGNLVVDREYQSRCHENIRNVSQLIAQQCDVGLVVSGDAWDIARGEYGFYDMCRDSGHDGEPGGGQYLNACVWFESLTGKSCVGNTWRPHYQLDEQRLLQLQQIAHRAVEENQFP